MPAPPKRPLAASTGHKLRGVIAAERPELSQIDREYLAMRMLHQLLKFDAKARRGVNTRAPDAATVLAWQHGSRPE